jgi:hypothetical protein
MSHRFTTAVLLLTALVVSTAVVGAPLRHIHGHITSRGVLGLAPVLFYDAPDPEQVDASILLTTGLGSGFDVYAAWGYTLPALDADGESHDIWLVPRVRLAEGLAFGAGVFLPLEDDNDFGLQPQLHYADAFGERVHLSVNAGYTHHFADPAEDGTLYLWSAPEVALSQRISIFCELDVDYDLEAEEDAFGFELVPGATLHLGGAGHDMITVGVVIPVAPDDDEYTIGAWYYTLLHLFE